MEAEDRQRAGALRLLWMVRRLHELGFERLRISPGLSPSGAYWRCPLTHAGNVGPDGFSILEEAEGSGAFVRYSSADEPCPFSWSDAAEWSAQAMAEAFLERFPKLAELARGSDCPYAIWLAEVLGRAEAGEFVVLYSDLGESVGRLPPPALAER
jgi:hypothetical protein